MKILKNKLFVALILICIIGLTFFSILFADKVKNILNSELQEVKQYGSSYASVHIYDYTPVVSVGGKASICICFYDESFPIQQEGILLLDITNFEQPDYLIPDDIIYEDGNYYSESGLIEILDHSLKNRNRWILLGYRY